MLLLLFGLIPLSDAPADVRSTAEYRSAPIIRCPSPGPDSLQGLLQLESEPPWTQTFFQTQAGFVYFPAPSPSGRATYFEHGEAAGFVEWVDASPGEITECSDSDLQSMRPSADPIDDFDCTGMEASMCQTLTAPTPADLSPGKQALIDRLSEECGCSEPGQAH